MSAIWQRNKTGRVYFVGASNGLVKIGFTLGDLKVRIIALQSSSPIGLNLLGSIRGRYQDEQDLHERFAADRAHGEWFRMSPALASFISERVQAGAA